MTYLNIILRIYFAFDCVFVLFVRLFVCFFVCLFVCVLFVSLLACLLVTFSLYLRGCLNTKVKCPFHRNKSLTLLKILTHFNNKALIFWPKKRTSKPALISIWYDSTCNLQFIGLNFFVVPVSMFVWTSYQANQLNFEENNFLLYPKLSLRLLLQDWAEFVH